MELQHSVGGSPISAVERETGLTKDTLRVWERRYGFPNPLRGTKGERVYPLEQVERLRVIRRLMDAGMRPNKIVGHSLELLNQLLAKQLPIGDPSKRLDADVTDVALGLVMSHADAELKAFLSQSLMRLGLQRFVLETVAPLNEAIGSAWLDGRIQIFEEHLYSEQVQQVLRQAIAATSATTSGPRILLTTLPGETHLLGLLMAEACFTLEGANCISLGVQTPARDIAQAARAHGADIVGLSFSAAMPINAARAALTDLRRGLDPAVDLWAGGSVWRHVRKSISGVTTISSLHDIAGAVTAWRAAHAAH